MDSFIADKISTFLSEAGFVDIRDINYDVPIGSWGGSIGELYLDVQRLALPAVRVMITELTSVTTQEYKDNLALAFKEVEQFQVSTRFKLIYATK
jgi:hypothetical protein